MIDVVSMVFKENNKFIIALPRSSKDTHLYTLIGGKVKFNETLDDAIIRECKEELNIKINKSNFKLILEFSEYAASNPNLIINMHMYITNYKIKKLPLPNNEIFEYKWFNFNDDDESILSNSIKLHLLPYLKKN